jgi:hypothetical protein
MEVTVTRRGGVGGFRLKGTLDSSKLPAEQAARAEALVRALPQDKSVGQPAHPDAFRYELTVTDADRKPFTIELNEDQLPTELNELIKPILHLDTGGADESGAPTAR